jgi:hypothetical protein
MPTTGKPLDFCSVEDAFFVNFSPN